MFLKRLVLVNWGNVPDTEIELGPINLFSGANGSGKTTAADAVQTVMTAAHESLFHYNPGQDESTQRGRGGKRVRTLASYVLGCDDGSYARLAPTDGYIAATFHPTTGESGVLFTALVGVRAWLDESGRQALAREDFTAFFIVSEVEIRLTHLRQERDGELHVVSLDEMRHHLHKTFGQRGVESFEAKRAYLKRLYGALRGRTDSVTEREALGAARAFSRFMAYKPVSSISQFVADEVLEKKDLSEAIRSVSGQLKSIHRLEREAQFLKESVQRLEEALEAAQTLLHSHLERVLLQCGRAWARAHEVRQRLQAVRGEQSHRQSLLEANASNLTLNEQRARATRERLVHLQAQRLGIPALQQKDQLKAQAGQLQGQLTQQAQEVLRQSLQADKNAQAARSLAEQLASPALAADLPQVSDLVTRSRVREVQQSLKDSGIDLTRLLQKDLTQDLAALEKHLDDVREAQRSQNELVAWWSTPDAEGRTHLERVTDLHFRRQARYQALSEEVRRREAEIARLEARQVVYPAYVEKTLQALRAQCPAADARVLCDYVEVTEPRWQSAIEGYLGSARFGILVDPEQEAHAIRIVRGLPGKDNRARIIQGRQAQRDAARVSVASTSILHVLKIEHAVAKAYLTARYAGVLRVESAEELRDTARGVTADGMGSGGYAMYRCDMPDAELVFGAEARERALAARRAELNRLQGDRQEASTRMQESAQLREAVQGLALVSYADALESLLVLQRKLLQVEQLLGRLEGGEHASLDRELEDLSAQEKELGQEAVELREQRGELNNELRNLARRVGELGKELQEAETEGVSARGVLEAAQEVWPLPDFETRLADTQHAAPSLDWKAALEQENGLKQKEEESQRAVSAILLAYNHQRTAHTLTDTSASHDDEETRFTKMAALRREIDWTYNRLKNNVLVEKHEELKVLKADFNRIFVQSLCHEIRDCLRAGSRQIDVLNQELAGHRFGSDRERFRFEQEALPEFKEYMGFLKEVAEAPGIGEGSGLFEAELSERSARVRDRLMELLLSDDEQRSLHELERIADYRNYHRYEIYKDVEGKPPIALSEYGTGSGGQLETPAYIIRSASITSAWRYAEGTCHLRMVLVDEAFSKMDETRSREVIGYLTRTLGLQLLFIMPTSKCGPFMDLVSHELVFAKVASAPRGQLRTRVLLDRRVHNQERIEELWKQHRRSVREQAELDFMGDVLAQEKSPARA